MTAPNRQVIAPGRVNLIGEHIDYNGLPVLPMALDRAVRIDFKPVDEPVVRLGSAAPGCKPFELRLDRPIERARQGDWSNYVRAAAWGLAKWGGPLVAGASGPGAPGERRRSRGWPTPGFEAPLRGFEGQVDSSVPIASGLASSSALVVAVALALLEANDATVPPLRLAETMAKAERLTGPQGGGMDQAACLCGVAGHAVRIDFDPLRTTPVPIPAGWRWIVASSLARAQKSREAMEAYNTRARECREALDQLLADSSFRRTATAGAATAGASASTAASASARRTDWSYRRLIRAFGTSELLDRAVRAVGPELLPRFRHVVTEGRRVTEAQRAMAKGRMEEFGGLMVASHESLRDDYQVSTPALDEIVSVALDAGAAGARLTGAGFGGCAVVLCSERTAPAVEEALTARFHAERRSHGRLHDPFQDDCALQDAVFVARPSAGARVVEHGRR